MRSYHDFQGTIVQDHQARLRRTAGVDARTAPYLAEIAADRRAEAATGRQQARRLEVAARLGLAPATSRRLIRVHMGVSGA